MIRTAENRPDLLEQAQLTQEEQELAADILRKTSCHFDADMVD